MTAFDKKVQDLETKHNHPEANMLTLWSSNTMMPSLFDSKYLDEVHVTIPPVTELAEKPAAQQETASPVEQLEVKEQVAPKPVELKAAPAVSQTPVKQSEQVVQLVKTPVVAQPTPQLT